LYESWIQGFNNQAPFIIRIRIATDVLATVKMVCVILLRRNASQFDELNLRRLTHSVILGEVKLCLLRRKMPREI